MKRLIAAMVLFSGPVWAQSQLLPTPEVQALGQKLMNEININIQCSATGISLQQQLSAAQAHIKSLEDKYEPKKSEEKK